MTDGPFGPATDLLSDVRFELIALNEQMKALREAAAQPPQVTVEPTPVVVGQSEPVALDFTPLLAALSELDRKDDQEELKALRQEFSDLAVAIRAIAGNSGGTYGIGASVVTPGAEFPVKNDPASAFHVTVDNGSDVYTTLEVLPDQTGAGDVLTFTFTGVPKLIWVMSRGDVCRAVTTGTPTATFGVYCDDGVPQPLSVESQTVQVYAPSGAAVTVWGYS